MKTLAEKNKSNITLYGLLTLVVSAGAAGAYDIGSLIAFLTIGYYYAYVT